MKYIQINVYDKKNHNILNLGVSCRNYCIFWVNISI